MSTTYGQMARASVLGPMSGMTTVVARRPLPLEPIHTPIPVYWPSRPAGMAAARSQSPTPPAPTPADPTDGGCCE